MFELAVWNPDLNIKFTTDSTRTDPWLVDIFCLWSYKVWTIRLVREVANPLLQSFGELPRILATLSLCLTIWYFRPFYEKLRYVVKTYHCVVDNPHLLLVLLSSSLFPQCDQRLTEGAVFIYKNNCQLLSKTSFFITDRVIREIVEVQKSNLSSETFLSYY